MRCSRRFSQTLLVRVARLQNEVGPESCFFVEKKTIRKRGGVQESMGNKVPWKTGMLFYLPVTSRPLIFPQKEAVLSPCYFAITHLTACILKFLSPLNFATHEMEDPFATPQTKFLWFGLPGRLLIIWLSYTDILFP